MSDNNATFTLSVTFLGNSPESAVSFVVIKPDGCAMQGTRWQAANSYGSASAKENLNGSIENLKQEVNNYFARLERNRQNNP